LLGAVEELPLVLDDELEKVQKTKAALECLKEAGCGDELQRVLDSRKVRPGKGKMRNRRYVMRKGPLVIYAEDNGIVRSMRNIPGVETACVDRLNLLKLAPGGNFGRFIIWTESAFKKLEEIYGNKKGYSLAKAPMENADVARIINSSEVQAVVRPKLEAPKKFSVKKNPLKNKMIMARLNPGILTKKAAQASASKKGSKEHTAAQAAKKARVADSKKYNKKAKKGDSTFYKKMMKAFETKKVEPEAAEEE